MKSLMPYGRNTGLKFADSLFSDWDSIFGRDLDVYDKNLRVHTKEEDDKFIVLAEVPGIDEDKLNIEYKDNLLTVSASYEEADEGKDYSSLRRGKYSWTCTAKNIDADNISAKLKNGVLTIDIPKSPESQPRRISISK